MSLTISLLLRRMPAGGILLLVVLGALVLPTAATTNITFAQGAYIINMSVTPQTAANRRMLCT